MADLDMGGTCTDSIWDGPAWTPIGGQYCIDFGNLDTILNTSLMVPLMVKGILLKMFIAIVIPVLVLIIDCAHLWRYCRQAWLP